MHDVPEPTLELLSRLLGKRTAKRVYRGSLTELFAGDTVPEEVRSQLRASHQLVERWMLEDMRQQPLLANPRIVRELLSVHFAGQERETFACLFVDNRHRLLTFETLFLGTIDGASVHPREIVKRALQTNAAAVILTHNHPSGVAEPSQADELITARIRDALALVDIRVLDHLVVGGTTVTSFAERGLI